MISLATDIFTEMPAIEDFSLRSTQESLFYKLLNKLAHNNETSLIAGTGVGKTVIAAHLAAYFARLYNPKLDAQRNPRAWVTAMGAKQIVFVVHMDNLIDQTIERFTEVFTSRWHHGGQHIEKNLWRGIGVIKGGEQYNPAKPIVVASIQSLKRRYQDYFKQRIFNPVVFIFDEAHTTLFCETGRELIRNVSFDKRIQLTATPFRLDKKQWYGELSQNLVIAPSVYDLTQMGDLCPVRYYQFVSASVTDGIKTTKIGFNEKELIERFNTKERINFALDIWENRETRTMQTIVFCINVAHAKDVAQAFRERGYTAQAIDYTMTTDERKPHFRAFKTGRLQVLVSVIALSIGFDAKNVRCVLDLQATNSVANHWQKIGRAMRRLAGKPYAVYLDVVGNIQRLGRYGIPHDVELTEELILSREDVSNRKGEAPTKFCRTDSFGEGCNAVNHASARRCKECGKEFQITQREAEAALQGDMVAVIRAGMVDSLEDAKRFYRAMRIKRWIKGNDPNGAFTVYETETDVFKRFPIPDPYEERDNHKEWSVGAITGKPSNIKAARVMLGQLKAKASAQEMELAIAQQYIDLNLYLEFNDAVYGDIKAEWMKKELKALKAEEIVEGVADKKVVGDAA